MENSKRKIKIFRWKAKIGKISKILQKKHILAWNV